MPPFPALSSTPTQTPRKHNAAGANRGTPVTASAKGEPGNTAASECRCLCGSLLARWLDAGLELKCRRCKRVIVVPWTELGPPPSHAA